MTRQAYDQQDRIAYAMRLRSTPALPAREREYAHWSDERAAGAWEGVEPEAPREAREVAGDQPF